MKSPDPNETAATQLDRRTFIKTAGAAATLAGGIEGILAARRAPAFAQGTKLHLVRWVDFIPEADVELKRQMPEASKALGAEVTLETINANDLQPRITAAVQSGAAPTSSRCSTTGRTSTRTRSSTSATSPSRSARPQGGFYERVRRRRARSAASGWRVPHSIVGNAIAYRKSWFKEVGANGFPKTWDECAQGRRPSSRRRASPYGQTLGHTFGDAPTFAYPLLWAFGGAETDPTGKKVVINSKEARRGGEVHAGVLEGRLRRGRARLGRHQQQPRVPRRRDLARR